MQGSKMAFNFKTFLQFKTKDLTLSSGRKVTFGLWNPLEMAFRSLKNRPNRIQLENECDVKNTIDKNYFYRCFNIGVYWDFFLESKFFKTKIRNKNDFTEK